MAAHFTHPTQDKVQGTFDAGHQFNVALPSVTQTTFKGLNENKRMHAGSTIQKHSTDGREELQKGWKIVMGCEMTLICSLNFTMVLAKLPVPDQRIDRYPYNPIPNRFKHLHR